MVHFNWPLGTQQKRGTTEKKKKLKESKVYNFDLYWIFSS